MPDLLAIDSLRAGYGEAVVLPSMSLTLAEGQVLALLGRNGTGKTTLINSIVGITRRFGGTLALGGLDITAMRPDQRARAGMDAGKLQRHAVRDHSLLAAGVNEQQVFLPVLEEAEIAAGVALLRHHFEPAHRRQAARGRGRDIRLDPLQRVDGDALALAQAMHQLAVVDGPPSERRLRHDFNSCCIW